MVERLNRWLEIASITINIRSCPIGKLKLNCLYSTLSAEGTAHLHTLSSSSKLDLTKASKYQINLEYFSTHAFSLPLSSGPLTPCHWVGDKNYYPFLLDLLSKTLTPLLICLGSY